WFLEGHYIHHFNGAMINNLPLIKKLKIRTVAGAGFMYIKESNFSHQEIFGGTERIFKLGARRRLKIGIYGILGQSNTNAPKTDWKISFDIIDTWKRDWSY
ncbi:MAG TPA: carboxypeptidase-like regulatory domain-containing protein, partial [Chryseosolibacter sp.]